MTGLLSVFELALLFGKLSSFKLFRERGEGERESVVCRRYNYVFCLMHIYIPRLDAHMAKVKPYM